MCSCEMYKPHYKVILPPSHSCDLSSGLLAGMLIFFLFLLVLEFFTKNKYRELCFQPANFAVLQIVYKENIIFLKNCILACFLVLVFVHVTVSFFNTHPNTFWTVNTL